MKEKLNLLRKNLFLELYCHSMNSSSPGFNGIIITNDKKIYYYSSTFNMLDHTEAESISDGEAIDDETYLKLAEYINNNIAGKEFEPIMMRDSNCHVYVNDLNIVNHLETYNDLKNIIDKK